MESGRQHSLEGYEGLAQDGAGRRQHFGSTCSNTDGSSIVSGDENSGVGGGVGGSDGGHCGGVGVGGGGRGRPSRLSQTLKAVYRCVLYICFHLYCKLETGWKPSRPSSEGVFFLHVRVLYVSADSMQAVS